MDFQAVKGTRDFYPLDMRLRNWIMDVWRRVSLRNGFEEYDAPIFEYLDLFTIKSGEAIVEQLFSFTDRGGRKLALRPEITPSLARMVNAKIHSLSRPIKWFSVPRCFRAEKPQRGRGREFFQWNVDIIGSDDVLADAECIFVAVDSLRELELGPQDVQVHIGSRPLTVAALCAAGVPGDETEKTLAVLDKRLTCSEAEFRELAAAAGLSHEQIAAVCRFQDCSEVTEVRDALAGAKGTERPLRELGDLWQHLTAMGVAEYCRLDMRIVRGLAYYTGIVWEVYDAAGSLRAVGGGGRYDDLLEVLGGPKLGATGFGIGDMVLGILLEEKGKLPSFDQELEFFVIDGADGTMDQVMRVVGALRGAGHSADFSYKRQSIGKQLKEANRRRAKKAVICRPDGLATKDLSTGQQQDRSVEEFLRNPAG